jgi:hypothetical protein
MKKIKNLAASVFFVVLAIVIITNCSDKEKDDLYLKGIESWRENRINSLKKPDSWLSLTGLYWLKEGENKFGSDKSNEIIFPEKAPKFVGSIFLSDSVVTIKIIDGIQVLNEGKPVAEMVLVNDMSAKPTVLTHGSLSWHIIKRAGNKHGIRLKDSQSELLKNFGGIETFPANKDWKLEAKFTPYDPPKKIIVPNVIGIAEEEGSPGKLSFKIGSEEFTLDVLNGGEKYFIVFADKTNGEETYGAGRFLTVEKPDSTGKTYIDFNKAYNPPCAFTKYATCPLPPRQNMLKVSIEAGEKIYGEGHN